MTRIVCRACGSGLFRAPDGRWLSSEYADLGYCPRSGDERHEPVSAADLLADRITGTETVELCEAPDPDRIDDDFSSDDAVDIARGSACPVTVAELGLAMRLSVMFGGWCRPVQVAGEA